MLRVANANSLVRPPDAKSAAGRDKRLELQWELFLVVLHDGETFLNKEAPVMLQGLEEQIKALEIEAEMILRKISAPDSAFCNPLTDIKHIIPLFDTIGASDQIQCWLLVSEQLRALLPEKDKVLMKLEVKVDHISKFLPILVQLSSDSVKVGINQSINQSNNLSWRGRRFYGQ
eukprot:sb/3472029/